MVRCHGDRFPSVDEDGIWIERGEQQTAADDGEAEQGRRRPLIERDRRHARGENQEGKIVVPREEGVERFQQEIQRQRRELRAAGKPEAEMEELFRKEREKEDGMVGSEKYAGKVGAFEGANYEAKGYYRPEVDCIMFTRSKTFCAVCRRAIERVIGMYVG